MIKSIVILLMSVFIASCSGQGKGTGLGQSSTEGEILGSYQGTGSVTQGEAKIIAQNLYDCPRSRITGLGEILGKDGTKWTVPSENHFLSGPKAPDLYNDCTRVRPNSMGNVKLEAVPLVEIDPDGEEITAYLFADNYFELYVNGVLVGVDAVPFTPFNSSIVRFKVKRPITYAVKLIDWEENLGLGSENNRGNDYHPGDGGFIASFTDGTRTEGSWKAQTFYIAPLEDPSLVVEEKNGMRNSSKANDRNPSCGSSCYALHYPLPDNWNQPSFDDSKWPNATTYTNETVGVDNKRAYTNFHSQFGGTGARFIWSGNLVLDNVVVVRKTVK